MRRVILLLPVFVILLLVTGCKKEQDTRSDNTATINVINGVINKSVLIKMNGAINNSGMNSSNGKQFRISFGTNLFYFNEAKSTDVSVLNSADSSVLVTKNVDFKKGGIYTMLLAGIAPNAEALVIDDSNIPIVNQSVIPSGADSVIYLRFINLCPDAQPVNIRLKGSTNNDFTGLAYKGYTAFKSYPAKITGYFGALGYSLLEFEIVENGNVIQSYIRYVFSPFNRFKNMAVVLTGMKTPGAGQPGLAVQEINYFQ